MLNQLNHFYLDQDEPAKSCLLALKKIILSVDTNITPEWKYKMPFFYYRGKMFCYLWVDKNTKEPYIGVIKGKDVDHPLLEIGDRKMVKIIRINPNIDLPLDDILAILTRAKSFYKTG
jgi:hypothetical protein